LYENLRISRGFGENSCEIGSIQGKNAELLGKSMLIELSDLSFKKRNPSIKISIKALATYLHAYSNIFATEPLNMFYILLIF
jgi:hypothetical protein